MQGSAVDELTDAVLAASRVLVAVAADSLAGIPDDLTLPQYRTLVVLHSRGSQSVQDLAHELDVVPSSATRMCDRLVRKRLIVREPVEGNRREVQVSITAAGASIVATVSRRRRARIRRIVANMPAARRASLVAALEDFAAASGEVPEDAWFLGWT